MLTEAQLIDGWTKLRLYALRYCSRLPPAADDVLSAAVLKAWEHRDQFRGGNHVGWMHRILFNAFMSRMRRSRVVSLEDLSEKLVEFEPAAPDDVELTCQVAEVIEAIDKLPDVWRLPLRGLIEGEEYHEVAERLGIPCGTVKSRLSRARSALSKAMT